MHSVASHLELDEVVSPELVLVDPELAVIARRRLPEAPEWRPQLSRAATPRITRVRPPIAVAAPPAVVHAAAPRSHGAKAASAVTAAIPLLLLGALVLAMVVSEVRARFQGPVSSLDPAAVASPPPLNAATRLPTTTEVEVRTLALLTDGSTATPAGLLDDRLGLLANNMWIDCRRVDRTARFTCRLGAGPSSSREWLLTVGVARDGIEVLTWDGRVRLANRGAVGSAL